MISVVVKFCEMHCVEAHRLLASRGLAPALHHFGGASGGLYMVVMDYEPGAARIIILAKRFRTRCRF
jgi:hypothetical protein